MKRKLALLLAVAMTLSLLPTMNLFASSTNTITSFSGNVIEKTVLIETGQLPNSNASPALTAPNGTTMHTYVNGNLGNAILDIDDNNDVERVQEGGYLRIEPKSTVSPGSRISVALDGAEWFFRNEKGNKWSTGTVAASGLNSLKVNVPAITATDVKTGNAIAQPTSLLGLYNIVKGVANGSTSSASLATDLGMPVGYSLNTYLNSLKEAITLGTINDELASISAGHNPNHNRANGIQITGSQYSAFNLERTYRKYYSNTAANSYVEAADFDGTTYTRYNAVGSPGTYTKGNPIYTLTLSADKKIAYIEFPSGITYSNTTPKVTIGGADHKDFFGPDGNDYIYIPLITRVTSSDGDVTVTLNGNSTGVSSGTFVFGSTVSGGTNTYVNDPKTARDEFPIDFLVVEETKVGAIGTGTFELSAPSNYNFDERALDNLRVIAENFNYSGLTSNVVETLTRGRDYEVNWKTTRGEEDFSVIEFKLLNMGANKSTSNSIPGKLIIRDGAYQDDTTKKNTFMLYAEDEASYDVDVKMSIKDTSSGDSGITRQNDIVAGYRKDWTISLTTEGDVPTLINGRYNADDPADADDEDHLAATVVMKENVVNAWWSGRVTNFTLPEGVKYRKVEIHDTNKLVASYEDALEQEFYNTNKRTNYVTINGNVMTVSGVQIQDKEKATLKLDMWLSVESGYEGDIELTLDGSGVVDDVSPIVIAKAISPVSVKAEVTPVKIGYQYFEVADITIQENVAGALERNKQVWISVTDRINTDMYFTPGYAMEVTEGNISIKDRGIAGNSTISVSSTRKVAYENVTGGGTIAFDVEGASSTASTIKLSNLQLKIDRTVPESTVGYDVYVWGPNVAPNSDVFDYSSNSLAGSTDAYNLRVNNDLHGALGIHTKYVEVATPAAGTNESSVLSAVVKVTAGNASAYRNSEQITIDPAPFIDSNSRMQVPVRALANLLGVTNEEIIWSNSDRTVTINLKNRVIQFSIGSDIMLVNGAQVRMDTTATISPDNDRTFVPFRALGEALGVQVSWDDASKTATYNSDKE